MTADSVQLPTDVRILFLSNLSFLPPKEKLPNYSWKVKEWLQLEEMHNCWWTLRFKNIKKENTETIFWNKLQNLYTYLHI